MSAFCFILHIHDYETSRSANRARPSLSFLKGAQLRYRRSIVRGQFESLSRVSPRTLRNPLLTAALITSAVEKRVLADTVYKDKDSNVLTKTRSSYVYADGSPPKKDWFADNRERMVQALTLTTLGAFVVCCILSGRVTIAEKCGYRQ